MKILLLIVFLITQSYAQTQFQVAVGTSTCNNEWDANKTTDRGYVICGSIQYTTNSLDMYIVKLDSTGSLQWVQKVGGSNGEIAYSIIQTTDGGYIAAGLTASFGAGSSDIFIVKLDINGSLQWSKTIGGAGSDYAYSIIQTSDGGYAIASITNSFGAGSSDIFIVKLDINGSLQWSKTIGGTGSDYAYSIIQTSDSGYAIAGVTNSFGAGNRDMYILKLDINGSYQWSKTAGGPGNDYAYSLIQTADGGYAAVGETGAGPGDIYIVKLDSSGDLQWSETIGSSNGDWGYSIIQTIDGGFIVGGDSEIGQYYGCLLKLNSGGTIQWSKTILCDGRSIMKLSDGSYAVSGSTDLVGAGCSDFCIVKCDANWNTCQSLGQPTLVSVNTGTSSNPVPTLISVTPVITTPAPQTGTEGVVTNICTTVGVTNNSGLPSDYDLSQNYPNPFNPATTIKFSLPKSAFVKLAIYDVIGKAIKVLVNEQLKFGNYTVDFDGSNLSSGVYIYKLETENFTAAKKMVLIK